MEKRMSFETNKSIFLFELETVWREKWVFDRKKIIFELQTITQKKKKLFWAWYLKPCQLCSWPILAQFSRYTLTRPSLASTLLLGPV